jgi:hypothetical protein
MDIAHRIKDIEKADLFPGFTFCEKLVEKS